MTKEAKIGLLMGLGFIIAIAVVLRGVHENDMEPIRESNAASEDVLSRSLPENQDLSVTVDELFEPDSQNNRYRDSNNNPLPQRQDLTANNQTEPMVDSGIRFEMPLPAPTVSPDLVVEPPSGVYDRAAEKIEQMIHNGPGVKEFQLPSSKQQPAERTYIVQQGDDLSRIAMKVYGQTDGKRWGNVKRIYEANRKTLRSMDEVWLGQKLLIPALTQTQTAQIAAKPKTDTPPRKESAYYTVQAGDSLWTIAQKKLGNGNRYEEIAQLNKKSLTDEDSLQVGMKIQLPVN